MSEIGNYYEPYRRRMREREAAIKTLDRHKKHQAKCERLVNEGKMRKVVTIDPRMHYTRTHYELIEQ